MFNFYNTPLSQHTLEELGKQKINLSLKLWDLRRTQYAAKNLQSNHLYPNYKKGLKNLDRALELNLLTKEACDWLRENNLTVLLEPNEENGWDVYWFMANVRDQNEEL